MLNEDFWKKVKYILLFILSSCVLFIVLTKFMFHVPTVQSGDLLELINKSEDILEQQEGYVLKIKGLQETIDLLDFDIHQVQRLDEIERDIYELEGIYRKNNANNKYLFGIQSSKILKIYFDSKEELSSLKRNNRTIEKNLEECKANI